MKIAPDAGGLTPAVDPGLAVAVALAAGAIEVPEAAPGLTQDLVPAATSGVIILDPNQEGSRGLNLEAVSPAPAGHALAPISQNPGPAPVNPGLVQPSASPSLGPRAGLRLSQSGIRAAAQRSL